MRCWRRCEPPSATPAWKSQFKATEEPRSISPTGFQLFWEQKWVKFIRYPNKGEWGSAQQVFNSFENKHVNYRNIPLFQKRISHKINDFLLKARPVHKRTLLRINISNSIVSIQELKINDFLLKARHVQKRWLSSDFRSKLISTPGRFLLLERESIKLFSRLGTFRRDGSLWENMVPFWTADNAQ